MRLFLLGGLWSLRGRKCTTHSLGLLEVSARLTADWVLERTTLIVSHAGEEGLVLGGQNERLIAVATGEI
jgi:hypothetical protein